MSDVVFTELSFKNFQAFGALPTTVDLTRRGTTLIMGENLDDGGGSSGAGKSTIINAFSFCLFDQTPSGNKDKLINRTNDKKNTQMEAEVTFKKGTDVYRIKRWRGATTGIKLYLNGADVTPASVSHVNDKLEEVLGFSYMLFSQLMLFHGNAKPFLDQSAGEQRALIEELLRITALSKKANALKRLIKDTERGIELQEERIKHQKKLKESHERRVLEAAARVEQWDQARTVQLASLEGKLAQLTEVDFNGNEELLAELISLELEASASKQAHSLKQAELNGRRSSKAPRSTEVALVTNAIEKRKQEISKLRSEIEHLKNARCPYCLQDFEASKAKLKDKEEKVKELMAEQGEDALKLADATAEVAAFNDELAEYIQTAEAELDALKLAASANQAAVNEVKLALTYTNATELLAAKNSMQGIQQKLQELSAAENPHGAALESLLNEAEVTIETEELDALILLLSQQKFLVKLLTDKSSFIRKNIISKTIPFLNKRIGYYAKMLNLPHVVLFQPDMTCEISQLGRELDHGLLSNGEKKKLNLSLCFAFRDVLTYLHAKVNILFTDEIDGGSVSGPDIDAMIGTLKHKAWDDAISIFIITHRPEFEGRTDRALIVRKEHGFSNLIEQPDA